MIKNKEDWWKSLNDNWIYIKDIIFHSLDPNEFTFETPGDGDSKPTDRRLYEELEYLRENQDPKLHRYLNVCWCMSSDVYAYSVAGWSEFCNLCSEDQALYEANMS